MTLDNPGDDAMRSQADGTGTGGEGNAIPEPETLKTRSWKPESVNEVREILNNHEIPWTDTPTDEWVREAEQTMRDNGDYPNANKLKSFINRKNPVVDTPVGRDQAEKSIRASNAQKKREARGTTTNSRGQKVNRKYPASYLIVGALLGTALLGGITYGGWYAWQDSVAKSKARQEAQAAAAKTANTPPTQVQLADPNQRIDSDPAKIGAGTAESGQGQTGTTGTQGAAAGAPGNPPAGGTGEAVPAQPLSSPPDSAALQDQYNAGKRDGQLEGYNNGVNEGKAQGVTAGQQQGAQQGYEKGKADGQQEGYKVAQQQYAPQLEAQRRAAEEANARAAQAQSQARTAQSGSGASTSTAPRPIILSTPNGSVTAVPAPERVTAPPQPQAEAVPAKLSFTTPTGGSASATSPKLSFVGAGASGSSGVDANTTNASTGGTGATQQQGTPPADTQTQGGTVNSSRAPVIRTAGNAGSAPSATPFALVQAGDSAAGNRQSGAFALTSANAASEQPANANGGKLTMITNPGAAPAAQKAQTPAGGTGATDPMMFPTTGVYAPPITDGQTQGSATGNGANGASTNPASTPNFGPYRPYQTLNAKLQTAMMVMVDDQYNLPVIAISSDNRKWVGLPTIGAANRVYLSFTKFVDTDGKTVYDVPAAAYDQSGTPGIQGKSQDLAPDLVRNLLRSAAVGVKDYADAQLNATTTTIAPNGTVVVSKAAPALWTMVGGRALSVFDLPTTAKTFNRAVYLPAGTPIVLMVGAKNDALSK